MPSVAAVGTGLIGRSWATIFAAGGWEVRLYDPDPAVREAAPAFVGEGLDALARHGLVADPAGAARRLRTAATLAEAVAGVDLVQESGPEIVEIKTATFAALDAAAPPDAVLASSSSSIVTSRFAAGLKGRHRCLVAHPVNPPHLVRVVELSGAPWTAPETIAKARSAYAGIGQTPILVKREIEGFVLNRLQAAVLAEAFRLVAEGYVGPEDLDSTIAEGLGARWSFMGPFATVELNAPGGMAEYCRRYAGVFRSIAADPPGPEVFDEPSVARILAAWPGAPEGNRLEARRRWRDERLAALKAHKAAQPDLPLVNSSP